MLKNKKVIVHKTYQSYKIQILKILVIKLLDTFFNIKPK